MGVKAQEKRKALGDKYIGRHGTSVGRNKGRHQKNPRKPNRVRKPR